MRPLGFELLAAPAHEPGRRAEHPQGLARPDQAGGLVRGRAADGDPTGGDVGLGVLAAGCQSPPHQLGVEAAAGQGAQAFLTDFLAAVALLAGAFVADFFAVVFAVVLAVVFAVAFVAINAVIDMLYPLLDPRQRAR